ncbi:MAG: hypothetical protein ACRCV9_04230 [Burkholderiaceae bacterium]
MNDYSANHKRLRTFVAKPFWPELKRFLLGLFDRERQLMMLRNTVGMMSEARRADAREYEHIRQTNFRLLTLNERQAARIEALEAELERLSKPVRCE